MEKFDRIVKKAAFLLNEVAAWGIVLSMGLVVVNVVMRRVFKNPILGTVEYTGFLTVLIVGCSIAYCAIVNGHIAIDFFVENVSKRTQNLIDVITNTVVLCFMLFFTWRLFVYAGQLVSNNQVSSTTQTPFYYFVYILSFGFTLLCFVLLVKIKQAVKGVMKYE